MEKERLERKANLLADQNASKFYLNDRITSKPFMLIFDADYFNKNDILVSQDKVEVKVIKAFKLTWWRKLLLKLGFSVLYHCVKVEDYDKSNNRP